MKTSPLALLLLLVTLPASALETAIAEFVVTSETDQGNGIDPQDFNSKLVGQTAALDVRGAVAFRYHPADDTRGLVRSSVNALQACEVNGWELMVYGQVVRRPASIDAEIRIYSHPDRKVLRTYLLRSAPEDYDLLIADCAQKIYGYFAQTLYLTKAEVRYTAEKNSWVTDHGASWWAVLPPWGEVLTTVAGYRGTYSLRFGDPLWTNGEWAALWEVGGFGALSFALNSAKTIPSRQFDLTLGPTVTCDLVWQRQQEIWVSLSPSARIHWLNYQPLYESAQWAAVVWYGGAWDLGYRFWADTQRTFGLGIFVGGSVYAASPLYGDLHTGVNLTWKGGF